MRCDATAIREPPRDYRPTDLGRDGERFAAGYLERLGLRILARRFRTVAGEIDLIAEDNDTLVFVEVKTRAGLACGSPAAAVDRRKQRRLSRAAAIYLATHGGHDRSCRFDVVEVVRQRDGVLQADLLRNAFEAS